MRKRKNISFSVEGVDKVMNNLNKEMNKIEGTVTKKGFARVAMAVYQDMEGNYPKIPVRTGNLRASWFVSIKGHKGDISNVGTGFSKTISGVSTGAKQGQASVVSSARSVVNSSKQPMMIFGFSAGYAAAVHEMKGSVNWNRSGSGAKFFETSLNRLQSKLIKILAQDSIL